MSLTRGGRPEEQVYSPTVEHPLLTIQDRISKLEETYRSMSHKIDNIDVKVATKYDIDELKAIMSEEVMKDDKILDSVTSIDQKIDLLGELKRQLTRQIGQTTNELTHELTQLTHVETGLELLAAHKQLIDALEAEPLSTIELTKRIGFTRQYLWERIKELKDAGYVRSIKQGRQTKYKLVSRPADA
ncbi:MAG: winged helix-turn-helix transcriptional regulator [Candidatus Diapherotrites archaeon]|nr:winged helix-turn-helix transcriptional regulator [Candidatus Diapherotrites archaeon]